MPRHSKSSSIQSDVLIFVLGLGKPGIGTPLSHIISFWYFFFSTAYALWNLSFKIHYTILISFFSNDRSFSSPLLHFWIYPQLHLTQTPFLLPSFVANCWRSVFLIPNVCVPPGFHCELWAMWVQELTLSLKAEDAWMHPVVTVNVWDWRSGTQWRLHCLGRVHPLPHDDN